MLRRLIRRSAVLAAVAGLVFSGTVLADSVAADGDTASGVQTFVDLGTVAPGASVNRNVDFVLFCSGTRHVDPGQVVDVFPDTVTRPFAGGSISASRTSLGPVPTGWASDLAGPQGCPGPMQVTSAVPSHVTIVAPATPGVDYAFSVNYGRTLTPAGVLDGQSVQGFTVVTFLLDVEVAEVPDTTAPVFVDLPGNLDLVTGDPAGTILDYEPPTASDDRDPAPSVVCDPAPGAVIPVGMTTATCTATDASGNAASATFDVVVRLVTLEWGDPVGEAAAVTATRGRSLPVKARAWLDDVALDGPAGLEVWSCGARATGPERTAAAAWQADAGRWMSVLDTTGLGTGCHVVALVRDGSTLGSFTLEVVDPPVAGSAGAPGPRRLR